MGQTEDLKQSEARKAREAAFHDNRYSDDPRRVLSRFYEATHDSRRRFEELRDAVPAGSSVLELGCGVNAMSFALAERGCNCTAIDISAEAVRQTADLAAKRGVEVEAVVADAEATGLPDRSFDYVIGNSILHHLDVGAVAKEIDRILAPTGQALFVEPLGVNPLINWYRDRTPDMRTPDEHPLLPADMTTLALNGAFEVDVEFCTLTQLAVPCLEQLAPVKVGAELLSKSLARIDKILLGSRSPLRWLAWTAVIRVRR